MSPNKYLGQLKAADCILMVCDLQERFAPSIHHFDDIVANSEKLIKASKVLDMPILVTEQYPKGLGNTVAQLRDHLDPSTFISKTQFTMVVPEMKSRLEEYRDSKGLRTIILCGIETHVCIIATCQDLLEMGFNVHVVGDAVSSRSQTDRIMALDRMKQIGSFINTMESVILSLAGDSKHEDFKTLQTLIKELGPDTGLLN